MKPLPEDIGAAPETGRPGQRPLGTTPAGEPDLMPAADGPDLTFPAGSRVLVVMAKPLVRGAVKSRLAASVGPDEALTVYRHLLAGTLTQAELVEGVVRVLAEAAGDDRRPDVTGDAPRPGPMDRGPAAATTGAGCGGAPSSAPDSLAGRPGDWRRLWQRGGSLGERLAAMFADLFAAGAVAVVAVDSDSPPIPVAYLDLAFAAIDGGRPVATPSATKDGLVLGPAADGGYYLIGVGRPTWERHGREIADLLLSSPMSSPALLAATLRGAREQGLTVTQLPLWVDVDRAEDLAVLRRLSREAPRRGEPLRDLREVYLHVTHRCGRRCRHCYDRSSARDPEELTTAEWKTAMGQCAALGARSFVFIGGDPLLRVDFVELVDHATGALGGRARFFFNSRIGRKTAAALAQAGRGRLTPLASIDGPRDVNDALRGPGSYDDVMAAIAELRAAGLEPVANTVLVRPALPRLPQLARELREAGVRRLHLILPHQHGGLPGELDLVPTGEELLAAVRDLLAVAVDAGLTVDNLASWRRRVGAHNDLCAAGCRDLAIDPYGNVHACVITAGDPAFVAGSLRGRPLEEIWRSSDSFRLLRASRARDRAECAACPVADACGGECWVQAHYAARAHEEPAGYAAAFPYCGLVRPVFEELAAEAGTEAGTVPGAGAGAVPGAAPAPAEHSSPAAAACGGQAAAGTDDYALFDCI